jgi:acetyl-CoA acetyltransferase
MLAAALKEVVARAKLDPKLVEDIAVGNNLQSGAG